ncbi:MAG: DUF4261 domain-containing protein [Lachnospiraceae bacterium]
MLFGKKKNEKEEKNSVLKQDLSSQVNPGAVFIMSLLMKKPPEIPNKESITEILQKYLGEVDCFAHDGKMAGVAVKKYTAEFKDASMPPQLFITGGNFDAGTINDLYRSQMWDCRNDSERILSECNYQIIATDMMAATLPAHDRADMLMDYLEALMELFPECEAVYFHNSGKMFLSEQIREHEIPKEDRFIYFAVNARLFNIQGSDSMIVDTLGMSTLFLPDLQYHFHGMDPNQVVNHAYNMASYIFANDNPIKDGDTIDSIENGEMNMAVQWQCHYEDALIQPARQVIDVYMNEYAAGNREY